MGNVSLKNMHLPLDSSEENIRAVANQVQTLGLALYGCGVIYMKNAEQVSQAFEYAKAGGMKTIIGVPSHDLLKLVDTKVKEYDIMVAIHNHGPSDKIYPFKVCQVGNDTYRMLEEYKPFEDNRELDRSKYIVDYLNNTKKFTIETKQLSPTVFKELKQYAILPMKRKSSSNPHYVVFCGWKKGLFLLYDPNTTLRNGILTTEDFLDQYQGTALVIFPSLREKT